MIVRYGGTYIHIHESSRLITLEPNAMYDNKTTDNIERDDSEDEDGRNTDAAGNGTENNDEFLRDLHQDSEIKNEDFGATANITKWSKMK